MYSGQAIVLRNLRQIPPNTAKVIRLQKQFVEAVQRYQELNERPDKDEAMLQELLREIAVLDKTQREELDLVREAELKCISQEIQNDLFCSEKLSDPGLSAQTQECSETEDEFPPSTQELKTTGEDISSSSTSAKTENFKEPNKLAVLEEIEEEQEKSNDEQPMDWEDLTREQWSESDRLLQKVERVGTKVLQRDFMSTVELVHVSHYKKAEEALIQRKAKAVQGKKVITTGPWQIIDIPTKVSNRRCNYLTGLHVTIRQKDPKRSVMTSYSMEPSGVKTRHHDSRGSSRASSRASSPVFSQTESYNSKDNYNSGSNAKHLRSTKTRAKSKKASPTAPSKINNNNYNQQNKSSPSSKTTTFNSNPSNKPEPVDSNSKNSSRALEPCVTYTLVDGVPHFKVFFPSSNDSITSPAAGGIPKTAINGSPSFSSTRASIVESDIEIMQTNNCLENGSSPRITPERKIKPSSKPIKRPRLSHQGFSLSTTPIKAGTSNVETVPNSTAIKAEETGNKEEMGRCIEKCGSWMGAPHFKFYRTFPSVNATVASTNWSGSANSTVTTVVPPKSVVIAPAPKLSSPITTPKLVIASSNATSSTATTVLPAMPKLTMGNQGLKNFVSPSGPPLNAQSGKFVPIAPKVASLAGGVSNYVIVPFADKNNGNQSTAIKRPISLLKTCPPLSSSQNPSSAGTFLTVKNLKECFQNNKQYKDMKVVVQKVPVTVQAPTTGTASGGNQSPGQRVPLASDKEDLKKKVVKLFPSTDKEKANGDDSHHLTSPTVIVADMSM
ncbi:hypothetical protein OUZ56_021063 [Daphnia magna]|uniref:Uncharacterized protein n=1 Tax=Daphnia magna TaxID=35525 RepID=A0ABQ9ZGB8_9CRUS|nr:hypothetical protein OUZ56_021063 [Daphnia magna]